MDKFRHPKEMKAEEERVPASTRIKVSSLEALEKASKEANLSLSKLIANVLDDYAAWLSSNGLD